MKKLFTLIFACLVSINVFAGYESADILIEKCTPPKEPKMSEAFNEISCIGYVGGVMDGAQMVFGIRPASTLFCLPPSGISTDKVVKYVKHWVSENPSKGSSTTGRMAVLIVLAKAYPCK